MRAVATSAPVETPTLVDCTDAQFAARSPAVSFSICNFLTGVLGNFSSMFEGNSCKASPTFNSRFFDRETWRQTEFHVVRRNTYTDGLNDKPVALIVL